MILRSKLSGKALLGAFLLFVLPCLSLRAEYIDFVDDYDSEGCCYLQSRRCCELAVGIGLGVLIFAGMIAVVFEDGTSCHHH